MRSSCRIALLAAVAVCPVWLVCLPGTAEAHLALLSPPSRYGQNVLKAPPCGQTDGTRSAHVTVLRPGSIITVEWNEYINHPGHFRISFDADGDDSFVNPVCTAGCTTTKPTFRFGGDPSILLDDIPDTPAGGVSRVQVTLPDIECNNCTLQAIQVMYDKPPFSIPGNDIYYQCADLVLSRTAKLTDGGAEAPSADGGGDASGAFSSGSPSSSADSGGCAVSREHHQAKMPLPLVALALAAMLRRRSARA